MIKLLLIEDEMTIANFLIRGLKYEGYKIEHISDGKEAMRCILKNAFDIIILDLRLPGMSGEEILKKMRARKNMTPVIILTAMDNMAVKTKILNAGADDYLVKPFSFSELVARIKAVSRRSKTGVRHDEALEIGGLRLMPSMRMVAKNGKNIRLRMKEYALLEYLMRNPDSIITRSALMENIWNYNARIFSNTIDSHISSLRKKIDRDSKDEIIETIHGVGYILKSR
jgi:DNA-binding response OmpR family regulator